MNHEHNGHANLEDLDVLALRYVTDELTVVEVRDFEARLADDQEARESVSRMVLLGTAIVRDPAMAAMAVADEAAMALETVREIAIVPRVGGWRLAVAAVLIAACGLTLYFNRSRGTATPAGAITKQETPLDQDAQVLIASWVEFSDLPDDGFAETGLEETLDTIDDVEGIGVRASVGVDAPSWMLQALAK